MAAKMAGGSSTATAESALLLAPMPAALELTGGTVQLPGEVSVYEETPSGFSKTIIRELKARRETVPDNATVRLLSADSAPDSLASRTTSPEGYAIRIAGGHVDIWASTGAGHLYGAMTVRQLMQQYGRRLPGMLVSDSPVFKHRGVQLTFPQGHTSYRQSYLRHLIPTLALWKINELHLYLESYFDFPSLPHMAGPDAMTPDDARALDKLCASYNIKVIPILNTLGHCGEILATQRYQHLSEYDPKTEDPRLTRPFNLCACSGEVRTLVDGMINDLCDCFSSDLIHIGGDEVSSIGTCPRCRREAADKDPFPLYLSYFDRVFGILAQRGRKGALWGDMLLEYGKELSVSARKEVFKPFVDRAVIYDWHYFGASGGTLQFFAEAGFTTVACSSTHLCYSSALWPFQHLNQWELFRDAAAAGVSGGMTTAWCNWNGLHEEHFNYLHATGGAMLWSGPAETGFAENLSLNVFEGAYSLQRYGMKSGALTDYLHAVGDVDGPILNLLKPFHGVELRKCLYHTDNPLLFWKHYAKILSDGGLKKYKTEVAKARRLWTRVEEQRPPEQDAYLTLHVGPLLMHEHLIQRFEMTEAIYRDYDAAAKAQYKDPSGFRDLLAGLSVTLLSHLEEFAPIEAYLKSGRKLVGFDRSTINRINATKKNIRELAAFMEHLGKSHRPLPAFQQLADTFLATFHTRWYGNREHDWAAEAPRFKRYTVNDAGPWPAVAGERRWTDDA